MKTQERALCHSLAGSDLIVTGTSPSCARRRFAHETDLAKSLPTIDFGPVWVHLDWLMLFQECLERALAVTVQRARSYGRAACRRLWMAPHLLEMNGESTVLSSVPGESDGPGTMPLIIGNP